MTPAFTTRAEFLGPRIITRPRDGYQFVLCGSHTSTAPVNGQPMKADDCHGCGTKRQAAP